MTKSTTAAKAGAAKPDTQSERFSFHDGHLTGIQLGDGAVTLSLTREDGTASDLLLTQLKALHVEGFRQGNIVNYVEVIRGTDPEDAGLTDRLFPGPHPDAAARFHGAHADYVAAQVASVAQGDTMFVVVVPSYGAFLIAHCGAATLIDR